MLNVKTPRDTVVTFYRWVFVNYISTNRNAANRANIRIISRFKKNTQLDLGIISNKQIPFVNIFTQLFI